MIPAPRDYRPPSKKRTPMQQLGLPPTGSFGPFGTNRPSIADIQIPGGGSPWGFGLPPSFAPSPGFSQFFAGMTPPPYGAPLAGRSRWKGQPIMPQPPSAMMQGLPQYQPRSAMPVVGYGGAYNPFLPTYR